MLSFLRRRKQQRDEAKAVAKYVQASLSQASFLSGFGITPNMILSDYTGFPALIADFRRDGLSIASTSVHILAIYLSKKAEEVYARSPREAAIVEQMVIENMDHPIASPIRRGFDQICRWSNEGRVTEADKNFFLIETMGTLRGLSEEERQQRRIGTGLDRILGSVDDMIEELRIHLRAEADAAIKESG